jgi:hypothetical protein
MKEKDADEHIMDEKIPQQKRQGQYVISRLSKKWTKC